MTRSATRAGYIGVVGLAALWGSLALAQTPYAFPPPYTDPFDYGSSQDRPSPPDRWRPDAGPSRRAYHPPADCCLVPAGTEVAVQLVGPVGTQESRQGSTFALRLAAPVIIDGQIALPAGATGLGWVVQSSGPGLGGKGAKLVVSAEYLDSPDGSIPLQGLQLTGIGQDQSLAANAASLGGLIFMPLSLAGFAVQGGDIEIPAGTTAAAKIARSVMLRPVAAATREDYDTARAVFGARQTSRGWITVPPPPPGMGQVVFFRRRSLLGTGQWFNVREEGEALGKLTNGAYFIAPLQPRVHRFTATSEPEFKDQLTLKIDPGETYYVEGVLTKGLVIGVADLTPSDKARFDELSGDLDPAPAPEPYALAAPAAQPSKR